MQRVMLLLLALNLLACANAGKKCLDTISVEKSGVYAFKSSFTTDINPDNTPVDCVSESSLGSEKICSHVEWLNLTPGKSYEYVSTIYDGEGALVLMINPPINFTVDTRYYYMWTCYRFHEIDKPGNWKFEVYLNEEKVTEKTLTVLPR